MHALLYMLLSNTERSRTSPPWGPLDVDAWQRWSCTAATAGDRTDAKAPLARRHAMFCSDMAAILSSRYYSVGVWVRHDDHSESGAVLRGAIVNDAQRPSN